MLKKEVKKNIKFIKIYKSRILALVVSYILITGVILKLPYFNLFVLDTGWKVSILYFLFVVWLRPSYNILVLSAIFFLLFDRLGEISGILIYISLSLALIKIVIERRRVKVHHQNLSDE